MIYTSKRLTVLQRRLSRLRSTQVSRLPSAPLRLRSGQTLRGRRSTPPRLRSGCSLSAMKNPKRRNRYSVHLWQTPLLPCGVVKSPKKRRRQSVPRVKRICKRRAGLKRRWIKKPFHPMWNHPSNRLVVEGNLCRRGSATIMSLGSGLISVV